MSLDDDTKKPIGVKFWNSTRIAILVSILMFIATATNVIWNIHPAFLFPEEQSFNPNVQLESTFFPQQNLNFIENFNRSMIPDSIEKLNTPNSNDKEKYLSFKFGDADNSNRFILVVFTDPNNLVRYSSPLINGNVINQSDLVNLKMYKISTNKYVKIPIPDLSKSNIDGIWRLNIYVFNPQYELTLVASKPIDSSNFPRENSIIDLMSLIVTVIAVIITLIAAFFQIFQYFKENNKNDETKKYMTTENVTKQNPVLADPVKQEPVIEKPVKEEQVIEKSSELINPSRLRTLQGLVVNVSYGLVKRCPQCDELLQKGKCPTHERVKGDYDLFVKAILYNGISDYNLVIKRPILEKYFDKDLDSCIALAADHLDPGVVNDLYRQQMIGNWFVLKGIYSFNAFEVTNMEVNDQYSRDSALMLYDKWKSGQDS